MRAKRSMPAWSVRGVAWTLPQPPGTPTHSSSQNQHQGDVVLQKKMRVCLHRAAEQQRWGWNRANLNYFHSNRRQQRWAIQFDTGAVLKWKVRTSFSISHSFELEGRSQVCMECKEHGSRQAALKNTGKEAGKLQGKKGSNRYDNGNGSPPGELNLPASLATSYSEPSTDKAGEEHTSHRTCTAHCSGPSSLAAENCSSTQGGDCLRPPAVSQGCPYVLHFTSPRKLLPFHL